MLRQPLGCVGYGVKGGVWDRSFSHTVLGSIPSIASIIPKMQMMRGSGGYPTHTIGGGHAAQRLVHIYIYIYKKNVAHVESPFAFKESSVGSYPSPGGSHDAVPRQETQLNHLQAGPRIRRPYVTRDLMDPRTHAASQRCELSPWNKTNTAPWPLARMVIVCYCSENRRGWLGSGFGFPFKAIECLDLGFAVCFLLVLPPFLPFCLVPAMVSPLGFCIEIPLVFPRFPRCQPMASPPTASTRPQPSATRRSSRWPWRARQRCANASSS